MRQLCVLEPFAGDGLSQIVNYAYMPWVARIVGWEMDPMRASVLMKVIPGSEVKTCDAYKEVHKLTPSFDVIVIDNNLVQAPTFEHFDLFPAIFKGLKDESFIIISVCQSPGSYFVDREPRIRGALGSMVNDFVKDWDRARTKFYGYPDIQDIQYDSLIGRLMPMSDIPAHDMVPKYTELAIKSGFFTAYQTVIRRSKQMSYIVLELKRVTPRQELEQKKRDKIERQNAEKIKEKTDKPA